MKTRLAAAALLLATTLPFGTAFAQSGPITDPAKVDGGDFVVEPLHTQVMFAVSHMGFTTFYGSFTNASGTLEFKPKTPGISELSVSVPVDTVSTVNEKLTGELKSPAWLDAAQFPTMNFKATKVTVSGRDTGHVIGELTLHGVTKPVTFAVRFNGAGVNPLDKGYTVGFNATAHIKRSDFGVKTYVPLIGDEVEIIISAAFEKKPS